MSRLNDAARAFPGPCQFNQRDDIHEGMTLRDYFAAKAMQGDISANQNRRPDEKTCAEWSYKIADEMIKARVR